VSETQDKRDIARYATEQAVEFLLKRDQPLTDDNLAMTSGFMLGLLYAKAISAGGSRG